MLCRLVRSYSARLQRPYMTGPQNAAHDDTYEIAWVEEGMVHVVIDGRQLCCRAGQGTVIAPTTLHSSWTAEAPARIHIMHLDRFVVESLLGGAEARLHPFRFGLLNPSLRAQMVALGDTLEQNADDALALLDALHDTLWALGDRAGVAAPAAAQQGVAPGLVRVERHLVAHLDDAHTVASLARRAGMSTSHFTRAFRRVFGQPPIAYLLTLRCRRAAFLMRTPERTLTEIAHDVGFRSSSRLTEAFRSVYGTTPSAFRKQLAPTP